MWSDENFLTLNPQKCKYMVISRKRSPTAPEAPLLLHNLSLSKVTTFKCLGVLLAEDLAWTPHVHSVCSKARQVLGLLYRRFYNYTNADTLVQFMYQWFDPTSSMPAPCGHLIQPRTFKNLKGSKSLQVEWTLTTRTLVTASELQSIVNLPTLERRRLARAKAQSFIQNCA